MRSQSALIGVVLLSFLCIHCSTGKAAGTQNFQNAWSEVKTPTKGTAGPIGFYSAGCLDGAKTLPANGPGYQVMRLSRNRYYGRQELLDFIENLTTESIDQHVGVLLIGDLGQPRGGPMPTGHVSHQIGLDADIWFWINPDAQYRPLTADERENLSAPSFVDVPNAKLNLDLWKSENSKMLELAAKMPGVDRIFVNAAIKRYLCDTIPAGERDWLHQLRPWFGHNDHFHVRLKCPADAPNCRPQDPYPPGDGCGDMAWWFTPEARAQDTATVTSGNKPNPVPSLPPLCGQILKE